MAEIKKSGASAVGGSKKKAVRKKAAAKRKVVARQAVAKKPVSKQATARVGAKKAATTESIRRQKLSADKRRRLIAEAAYLKAEQRGFEAGNPIADWLEAETEIDRSQTD